MNQVNGAKVSIRDCKNAVLAEGGKQMQSGIWKLGGIAQSKVPNCSYNSYDNGLLVIAEKEKIYLLCIRAGTMELKTGDLIFLMVLLWKEHDSAYCVRPHTPSLQVR